MPTCRCVDKHISHNPNRGGVVLSTASYSLNRYKMSAPHRHAFSQPINGVTIFLVILHLFESRQGHSFSLYTSISREDVALTQDPKGTFSRDKLTET